jgi:transposase
MAARRLGRPLPALRLTDDERETLERWARRPKTAQALAQWARVVLGAATGQTNTAVAQHLGVKLETVGKWRARCLTKRLDGLLDEPRPGAPRRVTDDAVERAIRQTLESKPADATHWSTRSLAAASGLSRSTVHRIWRAFALQPHRTETFKLSTDPLFVEKVRDIVGLYLSPPDRAVVLCVDEKSQIQALDRTQPLLARSSGGPTTTSGTAPHRASRPWMRRPAPSLANCISDIAASSSASSSTPSTPPCPRISMSTSSSTTTAPTRRR